MKWYEAWWHVWTHPGAEAFRTILRDPRATPARGFIWVAVVSVITALLTLLTFNLGSSQFKGLEEFRNGMLILYSCFAILTPIFAVIGLAISAAIYRGVASLFQGTGTWDKMVYAFAAVTAPATLLAIPSFFVSQFLTNPGTGDLTGVAPVCILGVFNIAIGIYTLVLMIAAIDGVENIGTGKAIAVYFLPTLLVIALIVCAVMSIGLPAMLQGLEGVR
jgi:hypothetical protein